VIACVSLPAALLALPFAALVGFFLARAFQGEPHV
jgi:hypothetical protein